MNVGQFCKVLKVAEQMHRDLGDDDAAEAIACFSNLLKGKSKNQESLKDFAESLQMGPKAQARAPSRR